MAFAAVPLPRNQATPRACFPQPIIKPPTMAVTQWMSREGGVDLITVTAPDVAIQNVIVHVARMVHTPVGSAPCGLYAR